jgi:hypothetical protein
MREPTHSWQSSPSSQQVRGAQKSRALPAKDRVAHPLDSASFGRTASKPAACCGCFSWRSAALMPRRSGDGCSYLSRYFRITPPRWVSNEDCVARARGSLSHGWCSIRQRDGTSRELALFQATTPRKSMMPASQLRFREFPLKPFVLRGCLVKIRDDVTIPSVWPAGH